MRQTLLCLIIILFAFSATAQTTGRVVDAKTQDGIPYANIMVNNSESLISNEEGYFTVSGDKTDDASIVVSYLGYGTKLLSVGQLKKQLNKVNLEEAVYELSDVNVSNIKPDPNAIMVQVNKNLIRNYQTQLPSKDMLFFRESTNFRPKILDFEISKSTGFDKSALKKTNSDIKNYTSLLITQPPKEYTDYICNLYSDKKKVNDKMVASTKMEMLKAVKLKDESRSTSVDDMQEKVTKLMLQHLDTTKYYRFKSGLFGSRDTISLRKDYNAKKNKKAKRSTQSIAKSNLTAFLSNSGFQSGSNLDFVSNTDLYEYNYEGATLSAENEFVYVLTFKPKRSKGKYNGKLYIAEADYAVVKAEYTLAEGKTLSSLNMKFLLGVKQSENMSNGTVIYRQNRDGNGYYLQYASEVNGQYFYINRPLKLIELTDEDQDVLALELKVEANTLKKTELLNMSRTQVAPSAIDNVSENDFTYTKLKKYDPNIWKDYSTIEPLQEMKQFNISAR